MNTRDKLDVPVGEVFGFYTSSLTVRMKYTPRKSFWENVRRLYKRIRTSLETTDIFRMLTAELVSPIPLLLDTVYGPSVYSDVEEKIVDVITIGGRISFMLTYNEAIVSSDKAKIIRDTAMNHLSHTLAQRRLRSIA